MVDELTELHNHECIPPILDRRIWRDGERDQARVGQLPAVLGYAGGIHTIAVVGRQKTCKGRHCLAQCGVKQIVAYALRVAIQNVVGA